MKNAAADYSPEETHSALEVNLPSYANAIVTAGGVVEAISSLNVETGVEAKPVSHVA